MPGKRLKPSKRIVPVLIGLLLLANTGCLGAIILGAGAAAAGAAAGGYFWVNGRLYRDFNVDFATAQTAVQAAMAESQLPLGSRDLTNGTAAYETRTTDGTAVKIFVTTGVSALPADGPVTRIAVRVGVFGDEAISRKILDAIGKHVGSPLQPGQYLQPMTLQPTAAISQPQPVGAAIPIETRQPSLPTTPVPTVRQGP